MTTGSKRSQGWVMAWLLALWCCQLAWASDPVPIDFLPSGPFNLTRFQPFSGCDIYPYGDRDRARCGWFATVDWLTWWSRGPKQVIIGDPNGPLNTITGNDLSRQVNSLDTGWIGRANATGWRIDFGQAGRGGGWLCSVLNVNPFTDQYSVGQAEILFRNQFDDPFNSPRQARIFETVRVKNKSRLQGVELMPFWRTDQLHHGGYLDWMAGVRYLKFDETFTVDAFDPRAFVWTRAVNNIVGPQVALRWFQERGRWQASAEGRFTAGWNMQNITQTSILDLQSLTARHFNTFSPVAEARVNLAYQFTSHILGQVGWTGIWAANIARPNTMIDYGVPNFGILGRNKQDIFVQGLNIGVVFNR